LHGVLALHELVGTAMDAVPERVVVCDVEGRVVHVNPLAANILGACTQELRGQPLVSLIRSVGATADAPLAVTELADRGPDNPLHVLVHHQRGVEHDMAVVARRAELGGHTAIVLSLRDWQEGAMASAAVSTVYQSVFERAPIGIFHTDQESTITALNDAFANIIGVEKRTLVGLRIRSLPDTNIVAAMDRALAGEEAHYEGPYNSALGQKLTEVRLVFSPIRDDEGHITGAVGIVADITKQKRTERALAQSLDSLDRVMEHAPDGIIVSQGSRVVLINGRGAQILGYDDPKALIGQPIADFVHPEDREALAQRMISIVHGASMRPFEYRMRHHDGHYTRLEVKSIAFEYEGKTSVLSFGRDVTERRELEHRLRQADRMASIGTLAAGVAHEINNPLAYVMMTLEVLARDLMKKSGDNHEHLEDIERMQEGCDRIRAIVRDLLTFSRHHEESFAPVDVNRIVTSSVNIVRHAVKHRAQLVLDLAPNLPAVRGDDNGLSQVIVNLVVNAAQAIPEGNPELHTVRVTTESDERRVTIRVTDDGSGIAPDLVSRIFEPFFSTKAPGVGTGLGLSICHGIVRAHGGSIRVRSEIGKGSEFIVELPRELRVEMHREDHAVVSKNAPARILVIDDEPSFGDALREMLSDVHEVTVVRSGRDGVEHIQDGEDYDMVLCDVMMPDIGGLGVYEEVRRTAPWIAARFVFMTGGVATESARELLEFVDRPRLTKPFTRNDVEAMLVRVRSRAGSAAA
jgi:PAS domain S-box-containing protein